MTRVGIIRNPRSRRNQREGAPDPHGLGDNVILRQPASLGELEAAIDEFAARKVDVIAIDGGDGTIRDVLSAAIPAFAKLPLFALLASGKTNVIAANVGSWGSGSKALSHLAMAARSDLLVRQRHRRPTLQLTFANRRLHGFVFGAGAYRRATALADKGFSDGLSRGLRVVASIGRGILSAFRRSERQLWLAGTPMAVSHGHDNDDVAAEAEAEQARFLFLATTLKRFMLGIWPFWGQDAQSVRYLDVEAMPRRLGAAFLPALRGRPRRWMTQAGYRSGSSRQIRLRLSEPFILDGEAYSPGPDGTVTIEPGPYVDFISR